MPEEEREIFKLLEHNLRGNLYLKLENGSEVQIGEIMPVRRGFGTKKGRPDFVVWVKLQKNVLGVNIRTKFPMALVEAETAGLTAAKEDFKTFFQEDEAELPAIVVGGKNRKEKEKYYDCKVKLKLSQLPLNYLKYL